MEDRRPPALARRAAHPLRPADHDARRRLTREREAERGRLMRPALAAVGLLCLVAAVGLIAAGLRPY